MMTHFIKQLKFDGERLILRNFYFLFFSLLMPAGFYVLFTRVMIVTGSKAFYVTYMGSMVVYSGLISAIFSMATILKRDRDQGFVSLLKATPKGPMVYYLSVGVWSLVMSSLAIVVIGGIATIMNHVQLSLTQWFGLVGVAMFGQIPLLLIGIMMANIRHNETLSLVSNVVTFPMAIISGLWWPINFLPDWLQRIGKLMPTYFTNNLIAKVTTGGKLEINLIVGICAWSLGLVMILIMTPKVVHEWGVVRVK